MKQMKDLHMVHMWLSALNAVIRGGYRSHSADSMPTLKSAFSHSAEYELLVSLHGQMLLAKDKWTV